MKYYSEVLKEMFDSAEDCVAAEEAQAAKEKEKDAEKERVKELYENYIKASQAYRAAINEFTKRYGSINLHFENNGTVADLFEKLIK